MTDPATAAAPETPAAVIDADLLDILVCPLLRCPLRLEGNELVATQPAGEGLRYPITEGIPVLLIDEARLPPGIDSLADFKKKHADLISA